MRTGRLAQAAFARARVAAAAARARAFILSRNVSSMSAIAQAHAPGTLLPKANGGFQVGFRRRLQ